ncbi:pseudouridine synthase [Thalassorhabdus alkalitolerans]|uniref:Pseudouridine synthase n=1 Tax=Thalassorhabdus alkalitolerans TaxID=2282697 RepID=A0ABW0YNS7_9BACI|nr:pseudouridine synthase [Bacillus sp. FJAT-44742]
MERLQKVIANAGVTSRRKAEDLIKEGRVEVNGKKVTELGTKVTPNKDEVRVDGIPIDKEEPVYYVLYKPKQVISAVNDDKGRKVVTDFLPEVEQRIFPVGRLDYDTSGLLLLTNDGEFANLLTHPKNKVNKTYIVKVEGKPSKDALTQLARGIQLEDGKTAPAKVKFQSGNKKRNTSIIEITIHEGKNRQVRRMFEAIGHPVLKLKREKYGFLTLEGMEPGEARALKPIEVKKLRELAVT